MFQRLDRVTAHPYAKAEYLRRAAWEIVERFVFPLLPRRAVGFRAACLRTFGARIEPGAIVRPGVRVVHPWLLSVGRHSTIGDGAIVYNLGPISIGDHTVVSQRVHLCAGTHDYRQPSLPLLRPPIRIGSGAWICVEAFIGPGVTVGDNAIVGARAVVTRDVPPGVIVAGNPARVVKNRPLPED